MIFYSRLTSPLPGRTPRGAQTAPTEPADELPESAFTSQFQSNPINDLVNIIREDFWYHRIFQESKQEENEENKEKWKEEKQN